MTESDQETPVVDCSELTWPRTHVLPSGGNTATALPRQVPLPHLTDWNENPWGTSVCLNTYEADLGPADACLDLEHAELIFTIGLTVTEQTLLARRLLASEGVPPPALAAEVRCVCGDLLVMPSTRYARAC